MYQEIIWWNFAIIPAKIRYNKELTDFQKLLFWDLFWLTNKYQICYAWNKYLADCFWKSEKTISLNISALEEKWFIKISFEKWNKRKITINKEIFAEDLEDENLENLEDENIKQEEKKEEKPKKEVKHKYWEFWQVLLTDEQVKKLKEKFWDEKFEYYLKVLDEWKEMKGYKYKNDYLAFLNWSKNWYNNAEKEIAKEKEKEAEEKKKQQEEERLKERREEEKNRRQKEEKEYNEKIEKIMDEENVDFYQAEKIDQKRIKEKEIKDKILWYWKNLFFKEKAIEENIKLWDARNKYNDLVLSDEILQNEIIEKYSEAFFIEFPGQRENLEKEEEKQEKPKKSIKEMKKDFYKKSEDYFNI